MDGQAVSSDGVPIRYEEHGRGAPPLAFIHGWSCDRSYWRGQLESFAARHHVVAVDLAGHGESGTGRAHWTMRAFAADVVSVVEQLDLHEVVLIGHSMGGDVIVDAALLLRDRVRGLVWVDTYDHLDQPSSDAAIAKFLAPFRDDFVTAATAVVRTMFLPGTDPELIDWVSADMAGAPQDIAVAVAGQSIANGRAIPGLLGELNVPVIAINTGWLPPDLESLARYGVHAQVMADLGHFAMLENPARFNGMLAQLLEGLGSGQTP
jgi:pimeloyl-ACP methyl ester carboxylesterase